MGSMGPWLLLGGLLAGGLWLASKQRAQGKRTLVPQKPPREVPEEGPPPIPDTASSMPTAEDFPMGWTVENHGGGQYRDADFAFKMLQLQSPSDACTPEPCRWVLVFSGVGLAMSDFGWGPFVTRDEAYAELGRKRLEIQR